MILRFGYALVVVTILLMIWASSIGAHVVEPHKHPPCLFSALCSCSKAFPNDLGVIQCRNVPYPAIPRIVNSSKVCIRSLQIVPISDNCKLKFVVVVIIFCFVTI